ncbi:MAG: SusD/RagB family nutrient-binding outer membrane lipoprotein [Chitinophagaceae bacterium]|nr:MAG: SusD/RagB family nutrient-binding outer membrane lipoprotein [Chitinophagaceae bacterium]
MRKYSFSLIALTVLLVAGTGCKKYVENGINVNPNASSQPTLKTLLPAIEDATATNHYNVAYTTSLFAQQIAAYTSAAINDDRQQNVRMTAFYNLYQNGMTNAKLLIDLANTQGSNYYAAIGKILLVFNLSLATDVYGEVPFSQAFQAPSIIYPAYDKQEDLYPMMHTFLDEAIAQASAPATGTVVPAGDDMIFGGVMASWVETAWFLKARLYMHTTKKGAVTAADNALAALVNAYKPGSKDCQLVYNTRNLNPWNSNIAKKFRTGNLFIAPSKRLTDVLNGTAYPGLVDPRISKMMDKKTNANYVGMPNGTGTGNNVDLTEDTYYGKDVTPIFFATYSEQKLMEAEARFLSNGGTVLTAGSTQEAYDAYLAGIAAHMTKTGVDGASQTAYLTNPLVAVTPAALTLELIMKEKQTALYLHPEAWVDVRRYDYNPAIYRGMALPAMHWTEMGGQFIRRSGLPADELSRNPNAALTAKPTFEKVWWDQ